MGRKQEHHSNSKRTPCEGGNLVSFILPLDEDSQWLRLREREELRDARKKIKSQEISIAALRTENRKLRKALDEADLLAGLDGLELELEEDVAF